MLMEFGSFRCSEIPMIEVYSEDFIDLSESVADWYNNRFRNKISSPLICYCTLAGTKVRASWMVSKIPQQLFIGFKRPCLVKDVYKKVSFLNQSYEAKSIIHQPSTNETVLSVCRTTGWVKVTEDSTIVKYIPVKINDKRKP